MVQLLVASGLVQGLFYPFFRQNEDTIHEPPQKADNCTNRHFAEMTFQDGRAFLMMSWSAHMPKKPNTQYHRGSHRGT